MQLCVLKGEQIIDSGFIEQIIEFDKRNMKPILEKAGVDFPEERRRKGMTSATFIVALGDKDIAGYIEYSRSWNDPNYIYIDSIQIDKNYRNSKLILKLVERFTFLISSEDFAGFETNVQKANLPAVKMYRKIGFKLEENLRNPASWTARADESLLETSPLIHLINKWRKMSSADLQNENRESKIEN